MRGYERTNRFRNKVQKLSRYWREDNISIPQPFRLIKGKSFCEGEVMEFMDLSLKEVLCKAKCNRQCKMEMRRGPRKRRRSPKRGAKGTRAERPRRGP